LANRLALAALASRPDVQVATLSSALEREDQVPDGVVALSATYPMSRYFAAFDASVAAAGYNAFHELIAFGVPTLFVPMPRNTDDQAARAGWAAGHDVAVAVDGPGDERLLSELERLLDPDERERLRASQVKTYTITEVDRLGMEAVMRGAIEHVQGASHVHVSLDMDVMDPFWAPGVGTPVPGGISYREAHLAMELLAEAHAFGSLQVVEVNPILDRENMTGELAVELICSALGQHII
jgi:hypothetical protein